jgi:hypothetical protein
MMIYAKIYITLGSMVGWMDGVDRYSIVQPCGWMIMYPKNTQKLLAGMDG